MKFALYLVLLVVAGSAVADPPPGAVMTVRRLYNQKDIQSNWETDWGSYDRDTTRKLVLDVSIRSLRSIPADVTLEVLFIARPLSGQMRWVFDRQNTAFTLDPKKTFHTMPISVSLYSSVQNYAALGLRDETGAEIEGYIVRILSGSNLVKAAASSYPLTRLSTDQAAIDGMIKLGIDVKGDEP